MYHVVDNWEGGLPEESGHCQAAVEVGYKPQALYCGLLHSFLEGNAMGSLVRRQSG